MPPSTNYVMFSNMLTIGMFVFTVMSVIYWTVLFYYFKLNKQTEEDNRGLSLQMEMQRLKVKELEVEMTYIEGLKAQLRKIHTQKKDMATVATSTDVTNDMTVTSDTDIATSRSAPTTSIAAGTSTPKPDVTGTSAFTATAQNATGRSTCTVTPATTASSIAATATQATCDSFPAVVTLATAVKAVVANSPDATAKIGSAPKHHWQALQFHVELAKHRDWMEMLEAAMASNKDTPASDTTGRYGAVASSSGSNNAMPDVRPK